MSTDPQIKMPFGRHKGTPVKDLPGDYLKWLSTIELRDPLRAAVQAALNWKAAPAASGVGSTTPDQGKPNVGHPTGPVARSMGSQRAFQGHDAAKPKPRTWIPRPESEDLSAYYTPQGQTT
jgi:hypothetical protein